MRRQGHSTHREKGVAEVFSYQPSDFQRILGNVVFIAEVFAARADEEIPDVPFLELARSFAVKEPVCAVRSVNGDEK